MLFLVKKHRYLWVLVCILFLCLISLSFELKKPGSFTFLRVQILNFLKFPLKAITKLFDGLISLFDNYIYLVNLKREISILRIENQRLLYENNLLRPRAIENNRLRELLAFQKSSHLKTVAAKIIGEDPTGWYKMFLVDKGSDSGIRIGNAVISPEGVVGRVTELGKGIAKVLLILDTNSSIDAMIERTCSRGVVEGRGDYICELKYVSIDEDVQIGDTVVCSGLGGIYPEGLKIGKITRVLKGGDKLFHYIEVYPSVNFKRIKEVLIVTGY